jgi:ATP-dependent helicase/nuclease subunit A
MTRKPKLAIDAATKKAVSEASNPFGSAWVSANAGSGKTFVLSQRVVRLLLAGADPGRILCLTFTKAAAAEMSKRVFATLANWTMLSKAELTKEIADIDGATPDDNRLAAARRLFARALETPGGLKIQTIHAFCERLLHQFPFEANVAAYFEVLEERDSMVLKINARRLVLARAAHQPDGPLGAALATVLSHASDMTYEDALAKFVDERDRLQGWVEAAGGRDAAFLELRAALGLDRTDSVLDLRKAIVTESLFDSDAVARLLALLEKSEKTTDQRAAARLAPYATAPTDEAKRDAWRDFFTTANGELRKPGSLVTKSVKEDWSDLGERLENEIDRLEALFDRIKAAECFETSAAIYSLADAAISEYERLKTERGALDFEDLITKTVNLLSRSQAARWVQYKLDRGLEHILVDEAQDTNPRQWQVILALSEEFFSGAGASEAKRTLFAVGDEKQSIFSFQGAVPAWFARVQRDIGKKARAAGYGFADTKLHLSFRSTQTVLSAVDRVFDPDRARDGVTTEEAWPYHTAARHGDPGQVVVWPLIEPPERPEPEDWASPLDHLDAKSPEVVLAERIATTIDGWLASGETIEATGKPIHPGGILILTRTRGAQSDAINRALKTRGIPIAGTDRLRLAEHIAIMDLVALGRVMLLPEDDLSLAALLKSPLVGLCEEALLRVAHGRPGSLWDALGAAEDEVANRARAILEDWRARADWQDPYAFFAGILGPDGGRQALMRRLGTEAEDVLDEFLAQALAFRRVKTPSLQGFLAWIESATTDIKRDTDMLRDEVRVMTVHGAKGLEAEIVFLVDTGAAPVHAGHDPKIVALGDDHVEAAPAPLVWMRGRKAMPDTVAAHLDRLRLRAADEYRRLLYVAMTRARDRLYVCGTRKRTSDAEGGWHGLIHTALEADSRRVEDSEGALVALEWGTSESKASRKSELIQKVADKSPLPDWAGRPALPPGPAEKRLAPSSALRLGDEAELPRNSPITRRGEAVDGSALQRGRLIHRLLQSLPDHPSDERRAVAEHFIVSTAPEIDASSILTEVMAVLDDPLFAPLFTPGSRAEVEIAGRIALGQGEAVVSGRIDRLAVTGEHVFIVDYKTNRAAPRRIEDVPRELIAQLALYRKVLAAVYPDRSVVAALLWTEIPAFMEIPARMLDEAESAIVDSDIRAMQDMAS